MASSFRNDPQRRSRISNKMASSDRCRFEKVGTGNPDDHNPNDLTTRVSASAREALATGTRAHSPCIAETEARTDNHEKNHENTSRQIEYFQSLSMRLRAHLTPEVMAWVTEHRERLEVFYLPRYAPELNADEYLNNDLKGEVNAAGLPHSKGEVRSRMQEFMRKLLHLPQRVMNYFQHPSVQYAAAMNL